MAVAPSVDLRGNPFRDVSCLASCNLAVKKRGRSDKWRTTTTSHHFTSSAQAEVVEATGKPAGPAFWATGTPFNFADEEEQQTRYPVTVEIVGAAPIIRAILVPG